MISQHWVRQWLGAVRQQATAWANVDSDLCHHMASLGHNELTHLYQHQDNYDSGDDDSTAPCRMKTHIWVLAEFTLKIILLGFIVVICEYVLKQTFNCQLFSSAGWEELTHPPPPPPLDKMVAKLLTLIPSAILSMKLGFFQWMFHCSLFIGVWLMISHHWFR